MLTRNVAKHRQPCLDWDGSESGKQIVIEKLRGHEGEKWVRILRLRGRLRLRAHFGDEAFDDFFRSHALRFRSEVGDDAVGKNG